MEIARIYVITIADQLGTGVNFFRLNVLFGFAKYYAFRSWNFKINAIIFLRSYVP